MDNKSYCVYKHTFPNNKIYIGITRQKPNRRWANGRGYKKQPFLYNAILKYGWDNIKHEVLYFNITEEEALNKEHQLVSYYKSNNRKYGYNIDNGGRINKFTEERKIKISEQQKNGCNASKGRLGKDAFATTRETDQYDLDYNFIKTWDSLSDITRELGIFQQAIYQVCNGIVSTAGGYYWAYHNEIPIFKPNNVIKSVNQINKNTNEIINTFQSISSVGKMLGIPHANIIKVCNGERKSAGGYKWSYDR